ncbi:sensor histidine kinase [Streptomyces sp. DSM 44917]|uniref:histidine kinase n=1 Tax=Streptomyces boetiae TaxID=3075541 RepID=A0ABU2LAR6_9ACTN|nr:sensor histidine kinase [Streptomyces sp. DSM 44917]MDT0308318.1 sensor histidine kinase [Streptomyces sp. DSM 44917]
MRKKSSHQSADPSPSAPQGRAAAGRARAARRRRARVRSRLLAGLLLTGFAVAAAGTPAVYAAVTELGDSREYAADARLARRVAGLSHTVADERDALVVAVAQGTPEALSGALDDEERSRADRAAADLGDEAGTEVRRALDALPRVREEALAGGSTPAATFEAYSEVITGLDRAFRVLTRGVPDDPTGGSLPDLARAVQSSAATRGLLLAALAGEGDQGELITLAQRETAREQAALADFAATAPADAAAFAEEAVAGEAVEAAENFRAALTDAPYLSAEDRALDPEGVGDALASRTGLQRGALSALAAERAEAMDAARGENVRELAAVAGVALGALLLAFLVSVRTAHSLTRPLAAVRLGTRRVAADPTGQEPVRYTGRNDEFAEVVASVNALRARAVALQEDAARASREAAEAARDTGGLRAERDRLLAEHGELNARLAALHGAVHGMFAHHAQRLLALVGEQLSIIEGLEEPETDPDRLAVLFTLDHLAARMRRHGENLLLLAGAEPVKRHGEPMPLIDVARAAVSEIERYELVETTPPPPPARITGGAARDVSHLLAELLDNATAFSPAGARVRLTARWTDAELLFTVEDEGVGLSAGRVAELNARLADPVTPPPGADGPDRPDGPPAGVGIGMGLYTVARLAARHGLRCWLSPRPGGGTLAQVILPGALVEPTDPAALPPAPPAAPAAAPAPAPAAPAAAPHVPRQPDQHARAADTAPRPHAVTDSGLPLRNPAAQPAPAPPQDRTRARASVDADDLRRRLGGFQRGAREGHRDAAGRPAGPLPGERGEERPS